jgi:hypothetical protein
MNRIDQASEQLIALRLRDFALGGPLSMPASFTLALIRVRQPCPSYRSGSTLEIVLRTKATLKTFCQRCVVPYNLHVY